MPISKTRLSPILKHCFKNNIILVIPFLSRFADILLDEPRADDRRLVTAAICVTRIGQHVYTVPIIHKFLEKRVCKFAGRAYTASTIFHGRAWLAE